MKNFTFTVPQDIIFGMGSLKRLPELLKKNGSAKMLLVSDRGLEKLGVVSGAYGENPPAYESQSAACGCCC